MQVIWWTWPDWSHGLLSPGWCLWPQHFHPSKPVLQLQVHKKLTRLSIWRGYKWIQQHDSNSPVLGPRAGPFWPLWINTLVPERQLKGIAVVWGAPILALACCTFCCILPAAFCLCHKVCSGSGHLSAASAKLTQNAWTHLAGKTVHTECCQSNVLKTRLRWFLKAPTVTRLNWSKLSKWTCVLKRADLSSPRFQCSLCVSSSTHFPRSTCQRVPSSSSNCSLGCAMGQQNHVTKTWQEDATLVARCSFDLVNNSRKIPLISRNIKKLETLLSGYRCPCPCPCL